MGIMRFNYESSVLGRYVDVTIVYPMRHLDCGIAGRAAPVSSGTEIFPMKPGMKFQTIYLIHGGGDDDTLPYRFTNAERYAEENHVMLVTPNLVHSFGLDTAYGVKYQTFLSGELPIVIQSLFASSPRREDNFIVGFAMGGNVALGTALMHPELYRACVDISGGIGMTLNTETLKKELVSDHFMQKFSLYTTSFDKPERIDGSRFDLYDIARRKKEENGAANLTDFTIVCGSEEFIRDRVEDDVRIMKELGYPVKYIVAEGYSHDWPVWDMYLGKAMTELLPLSRKPVYDEASSGVSFWQI